MKIATVLGTRPEIIRLSLIIAKLDALCEHVLIHTGQNFDRALSDVFFEEMGIRAPDHFLGVRGDTPAAQIGQILERCERIFLDHRPDRLLILGDTNSAFARSSPSGWAFRCSTWKPAIAATTIAFPRR